MKDTSRSEEIENQHQKFRQTARKLGADESPDALDKAFDQLEPKQANLPKKGKTKDTKAG